MYVMHIINCNADLQIHDHIICHILLLLLMPCIKTIKIHWDTLRNINSKAKKAKQRNNKPVLEYNKQNV